MKIKKILEKISDVSEGVAGIGVAAFVGIVGIRFAYFLASESSSLIKESFSKDSKEGLFKNNEDDELDELDEKANEDEEDEDTIIEIAEENEEESTDNE